MRVQLLHLLLVAQFKVDFLFLNVVFYHFFKVGVTYLVWETMMGKWRKSLHY